MANHRPGKPRRTGAGYRQPKPTEYSHGGLVVVRTDKPSDAQRWGVGTYAGAFAPGSPAERHFAGCYATVGAACRAIDSYRA